MDNRNLLVTQLSALRRKIVNAAISKERTQKDVARIFGFSESTLSQYVNAYKAQGEASLVYKKRGRKKNSCTKLSPDDEMEVQATIRKNTPDGVGLNCVLWTRKAVREYILKKYGVHYSVRGMGDTLKRWGFTPQKPTKIAIQQDPEKVERWLKVEYPEIKRRAAAR